MRTKQQGDMAESIDADAAVLCGMVWCADDRNRMYRDVSLVVEEWDFVFVDATVKESSL